MFHDDDESGTDEAGDGVLLEGHDRQDVGVQRGDVLAPWAGRGEALGGQRQGGGQPEERGAMAVSGVPCVQGSWRAYLHRGSSCCCRDDVAQLLQGTGFETGHALTGDWQEQGMQSYLRTETFEVVPLPKY